MSIYICMSYIDADSFAFFLLDRGSLTEVPDFLPKDGTYYVLNSTNLKSIPKDMKRIFFIGSYNPYLNDKMIDFSKLGWNEVNYIRLGRFSISRFQHIVFSGSHSSL